MALAGLGKTFTCPTNRHPLIECMFAGSRKLIHIELMYLMSETRESAFIPYLVAKPTRVA